MKKRILKLTLQVIAWVGVFILTGLFATGCQTKGEDIKFSPIAGVDSTSAPISENKATGPEAGGPFALTTDRFAVGDLVRVIFSGTTEAIQPHEERIKGDGTITLPLIGAVPADGKTPGELQKAITSAYVPNYYKRLTVTVSSDKRVYYVGGQVRLPGRQEYLGITTVTKAIQSAGDFTDFADRRKVLLTRADGKKFTVNCIKAAKDPALDLPVFPGDKIEVPLRGFW